MSERTERRRLRYWLYRIQTEAAGGDPAGEPDAIRSTFEAQPGFLGWQNFARSWDVSDRAPWTVVSRLYSEEELWNWTLLAESRELRRK